LILEQRAVHASEPAASTTSEAPGYRRIVVPLDGSALAEQAVPHAEALGQLTGAPLHLVRVLDSTQFGSFDGTKARQLWLNNERSVARNYLERLEQNLRDRQLTVTVEYRLGSPAQELLAILHPGDLLVMTTHGRSGVARWLLGSVAEAVVRRATVPVLLVRATPLEPGSPAGGAAN
jgi:nucleotide-binding universal stress UspA family protein